MPLLSDLRHSDQLRRGALDGFSSETAPTHYPPDLSLEPKHLVIDLTADIQKRNAEVALEHTVIARRAEVSTITFDAVALENLEVVDTEGRDVDFTYDGERLKVRWHDSFSAGEERSLRIQYRVDRPSAGLYFSSPSEQYPSAGTWVGTDHETERARHWLATIDHPAVRPTLEWKLTSNEDLTILANGELISEDFNGDGTKTAHWRLDYGCPSYLTCFAIGEFSEYDDGVFEGRPLKYYGEAHVDPEDLRRSFGRTHEMLAWMTQKLGLAFPFPKYFQFALPQIGGAMENISLVSWDSVFVLDATLATEWTWLLDQINVHEMAHSYFGDAIVCRDFSHAWLKESWATYIESCWLEDTKGEDEKLYDLYRNALAYFTEADTRYKRPLMTRRFDSSWDMYDHHLYPGGACRLHTLRNELGDDVFWAAVQDYVNTYAGDVVETDDFRRIMEKHSGKTLGEFFDQWVHTPGYPHLEATYAWDGDEKRASITFVQKQVENDEHCFKLNLQIGLGTGDDLRVEDIRLERERQVFAFACDEEPEWVQIDPGWTSLHKLDFDPGPKKLEALLEHGNVLGRIHAAQTLAKKARPAGMKAIEQAYARESFWGCKEQYIEALGAAGIEDAIRILAKLVVEAGEPMVLAKLMTKAGAFRDERLADALAQRLKEGDLPYWAESAALTSFGKIGDANVQDLRHRAIASGVHGITGVGAVKGLEQIRNDEALVALLDIVDQPDVAWRVRAMAASAAGRLASLLEKPSRVRTQEELVERLRDSDLDVVKAAVDGLVALGATSSVARIDALGRRLSHQERVALRRKVATLRGNAEKPAVQVESELEELRKKLRDFEKRLADVEADE